jgi:2,4-dienoyl-CoA reductase-like NADH-dependent reductase (Old Yellow Enzyme family)
LFKPGSIGTLRVSNRFIRSATAEFGANDDGTITEQYFDLYRQLALGEIGSIIQGHLYVLDEGKAHEKMAGISQAIHIERLKKLTDLIHNSGSHSKIIAQLNHGGAHSVSTKAPSIREDKKTLKMTNEDIEDTIKGFGSAARRAKEAGYDGIQIHGAHGYLLSQFLTKKTNQRSDGWGGSLENRSKLLLEVYTKIRSIVGSNFPILVKMNGSDDPIEGFPLEEGIRVAKELADLGLNMLEVSGMKSTRRIKEEENTYFVPFAEKIKKQVGDMPISVVGGFRLFSTIQKYRDSFADFISLSRPFIREPDLVKKFKDGKVKADCITCNKCFKVEDIVKCLDMDKNG